jgi:predicted RNA-binding protein with PUA-like domain
LRYWLVKSEPETYGWQQFSQQGRAVWDGVRNYQARNNLIAMQPGDLVLFYHSVTKPAVVGLAKVVREAYPDPTVTEEPNRWVVVELEPVLALEKTVSLGQIKADPRLAAIALIKQSCLSVMPVRPDEFERILELGTQMDENEIMNQSIRD